MTRETRAVRATADRIWTALTEPDELRRWWGELAPGLQLGRLSQLQPGDGEVHALEVFDLAAPHRLGYRRRLFGIDTKETVRWTVADGLVTVTASGAEADDDRPAIAYEQWREQLDRLGRYVDGEPLPPVPRDREFVLGTELPGEPAAVRAGLATFLAEAFKPGSVLDGVRIRSGPADDDALTFDLDHPSWAAPTAARIVLLARGQGTKLVIRHRGWAGTSADEPERARRRAEFAGFWHRLLLRFTLSYAKDWAIPTLTADDLNQRLAQPELFVFDANRATLWERGHLPGAVFVGQEDLPLDRLPADREAELVFYCRDEMCLTAYLSAAKARTLGYPHTYVMEGGRQAWADAGLPLVADNDGAGA